ncbi:MAG: DUF4329 domain-containing protein [Sedimentitalea sp.]
MRMILICLLLSTIALPAQSLRAQTMQQIAFDALQAQQAPSIRRNSEYCGLIVRRPDGSLTARRAHRGTRDSCQRTWNSNFTDVVAIFHTHGRYLPQYDNEVPSIRDMKSATRSKLFSYVSTPAGRFWVIDPKTGVARLICGPRCMSWDPRHVPDPDDRILNRYTLELLKQRALARAR